MSATTFSVAPFEANTASSNQSSGKSSFSQPPTITLTLAGDDTLANTQHQPAAQPQQSQHLSVPGSHDAALLSPPSPVTSSLSPPTLSSPSASSASTPSPASPTSASPLKSALSPSGRSSTRARVVDSSTAGPSPQSPSSSSYSSRPRDRSPVRAFSAFSPKASKGKSSAATDKEKNKRPPPPPLTPETPPEWLSQPHEPVYQTHTTVRPAAGVSTKASRSVSFSRKKRKSAKVESVEERRDRFYRMLHQYHIHAEDEDLSRHEVIFPPGLLAGEGDMNTFLGEFTALQSSYSALLTMLSSLPHLCLYLNADGCLASYNHDPSAFLGVSLSTLQRTPYLTWFSDPHHSTSGNTRHSYSSSRNQHFLSSVNLAYSSRQAVRQEQCMFMPGSERVTPVTLTIVPVTYDDENASSFDDRFTWSPPQSPTAAPVDETSNDISLSQHAFGSEEDEQKRVAEERAKAAEEERVLREQERRSQIRGVHIIIESKEHMYRLLQQTKRNKEIHRTSTDKRRNYPHIDKAEAAADSDQTAAARGRSFLVVEPKLDTSITSALQLMGTLQRQEKNAKKRQMYADIMHMLANSKGTESVNDDVINQIEDSASVGADVKSWLINQINPTAAEPDDKREKDEVDELIANTVVDDSSAESSTHSSIFAAGRRHTTSKQSRSSVAQTAAGQTGTASEGTPADTQRDLRASTISNRASQQLANRPSIAHGSLSFNRGGSVIAGSASGSASFSSPLMGSVSDGEMPKALTQSTDTDQYVDSSTEVSLIKKQRVSGTTTAKSGGSITDGGETLGSGRTERRKTLKERKSLHEKKSLTSRSSLQAALQKLPASTATLTSPTPGAGPVVAPVRPPLSLPLGMPFSDKHQVVERAADARVLYNNWSGGTVSTEGAETSRSEKDKEKDTTADPPVPDDAVVVVKDSVFTTIGCAPPEVHHNAALDTNTQALFWTNVLPYYSTTRPVTAATARPHTLLHSPVYLTPSAESALATSLSSLSIWNQFNIFHVSAHSQGWPLTFTFTSIVTQLNLMGKWGIDTALLTNFIREVERGYFANPYHSSTHAADVLQHSYHMLTQTHLGLQLNDLDIFLLLVAACLHDYGHPGVSNAYLTSTFSPLALQYNDKNVLESYHIASVFLLMQSKPECNLFQHMDAATYRKARKMLIDLVLATDLASHFDILAVWKRKESILDMSKDEDKLLVMQMILKSGDLGHPSRVRHLHLTWSELITEEFFQQGDRERKNGMNVSAMMDRHTCNIVTSQIGFISFLVMPIYSAFSPYIGNDMYHMLVKANLAMWERLNVETEELRRQKEDEEWELRRLAAEKEEMETRRKKEAEDKLMSARRKEEALEEDMRVQAAEEEEKVREIEAEKQRKEDEKKQQKERAQHPQKPASGDTTTAELGAAPPLLDMAIRRENDSEWTINQMLTDSESDDDVDDEETHAGDKEEEAERQRRREKKQRAHEAQLEKSRAEKQQEKVAYRQRELEERRVREAQEKVEAEERRVAEEKQKEDEWRQSREREEQEIEERVRMESISLQAKFKRRDTNGSTVDGSDDSAGGDSKGNIRIAEVIDEEADDGEAGESQTGDGDDERPSEERSQQSNASSTVAEEQGDVGDSQLPAVEEEEADEGDESTTQAHESTADDVGADGNDEGEKEEGDGEYSAGEDDEQTAEDAGTAEASNATTPRALSPNSLQQAQLAARLKESIDKDRQRVEAQRERERNRLSLERKRLMSAEERRAADEADRLEQRVKRVLKREQAKARAKAREEEVKGLIPSIDTEEQPASGSVSSRLSKEEVLESARSRERSVALRAVSLLMMDKEWGMKRDREEEKQIMLTYLQSLPEQEQSGAEEERVDSRQSSRRQPRQSVGRRRSAHKVADEEWEDDAEAVTDQLHNSAKAHRPRRAQSLDSDSDSMTDASESGASDEQRGSDNELMLHMHDQANSRKSSVDAKNRRHTWSSSRSRTASESTTVSSATSRRQSKASAVERADDSVGDVHSGRHRRTSSNTDDKRPARRTTATGDRLPAHMEEKEETETTRERQRSRSGTTTTTSKRLKSVSIQEDRNEVREHSASSRHSSQDNGEDDMPHTRLFDEAEEEEEAEAVDDRSQQPRRARRRVEFADEEKVMMSEASGEYMAVNERQRKKDKQRAMQAQKHRDNRQRATQPHATPHMQPLPIVAVQGNDDDGYPPLLSSSHSTSHSSPSLSSHPAPTSATAPSFASFLPPLSASFSQPSAALSATVPAGMKLVRTSDGQEVMMADSRIIQHMMRATGGSEVELPFVSPSNPHSMFATRALVPMRGAGKEMHVGMVASASAELPGSDWRAVEDEQAMAAILRRIVPRSRQAELERARRAIMLKARMRTTQ